MLPRREHHAGFVEEELKQLVSMLRHTGDVPQPAGRGDGGDSGNEDGGGGGGGAVAEADAGLAFELGRLREIGGSLLRALPMLGGQRDIDPREL